MSFRRLAFNSMHLFYFPHHSDWALPPTTHLSYAAKKKRKEQFKGGLMQ
jgi:hypothetical protein